MEKIAKDELEDKIREFEESIGHLQFWKENPEEQIRKFNQMFQMAPDDIKDEKMHDAVIRINHDYGIRQQLFKAIETQDPNYEYGTSTEPK